MRISVIMNLLGLCRFNIQVELIEGRPHLNHKIGLPQPLLEAFKNIMRTDIGDLEFKAALLTFPREELLRAVSSCSSLVPTVKVLYSF